MDEYNYLKVEEDEYELFMDGSVGTSGSNSNKNNNNNIGQDTTSVGSNFLPEYTVAGFSDTILLSVSLIGLCILASTIYKIIILRSKSRIELEQEELLNSTYNDQLITANVLTLNRAQRRARAHAIMKQKRRCISTIPLANSTKSNSVLRIKDSTYDDDNDSNDDYADEYYDDYDDDTSHFDDNNNNQLMDDTGHYTDRSTTVAKLSRKERQQLAKIVEKKERQLFDEQRRQQYKQELETIQKEKQERIKQKQIHQDMERIHVREMKARKEKQEYEDFLLFISTPTYKLLVTEWIEQIKENRFYNVNDVATLYMLQSDDIFNRIECLINECRVAGIVERKKGLFIYLNDEELKTISRAIIDKGSTSYNDISDITMAVIKKGSY